MAYEHAIVLTGGISTGKSTVSNILHEQYGLEIIDADKIAKEVLPLHVNEVRAIFGERIIDEEGKIDRKALGAIIFNDKAEREKLNAFLHPLIREEIFKRSQTLEEKKKPYIIDIPLYFESEGYHCKVVVVVYAPIEVQPMLS